MCAPNNDVIFESLAPERRQIRTAADLAALISSVKSGGLVSLNVAAQAQGGWQSRIVNIRITE